MGTARGLLLDADYFVNEKEEAQIRLYVKTEKKVEMFVEKNFHPYFYALVDDAEKRAPEIKETQFGLEKKFSPKNVAAEDKKNAKNVLKIFFKNTEELRIAREEIKQKPFVKEIREYDIPFVKRYLIDGSLEPMNGVKIEFEKENEVISTSVFEAEQKQFSEIVLASFDLETHSPGRFSSPSKDPVISVALCHKNACESFVWRKDGKKEGKNFFGTEQEVLECFFESFSGIKPDIVVTYNGDNFDMPYLEERTKKLKISTRGSIGAIRVKKTGLEKAAKLSGTPHVDAYKMIRILNRFGVVSLVKFDLESVVESLFGTPKEKVVNTDINTAFETGQGMQRMIDYNVEDAKTTLRIAKEFLPLFFEFSKLVHQTIFDSTRTSASALVEDLLVKKAFDEGHLVPNRPHENEVKARTMQSFKGGYVKEPVAGLHENIAVLDFRSLHPSIMIAHNISPETLRCSHPECMDGKNLSPDNDWFCEKQKGFIPEVLEEILDNRIKAKNEMKKIPPKEDAYRLLKAKQQALKILLNSHYGYLGYPRSRWYSMESAKAVTAWSRHYIRDISAKAEENGFLPIYGDSITSERFVTIKNPNGHIEVKNIEELFEENKQKSVEERGKEFISLRGFEALSVNPSNLSAEWKPINVIIRHKTNKKIYRVAQKFGETKVTQDHSILTRNGDALIETKPTEMHEKKFFTQTIIPHGNEVKEIDTFKELEKYCTKIHYKNRVKIAKVFCDDNYVWYGWMNKKETVKLKRFIKVDSKEFEAMCRLLGAYIAEGSSSTIETTKTRFGASIASSNKEWLKGLQEDYNLLFDAEASIIPSMKHERILTYNNNGITKTVQYADLTHKLLMMNGISAVFFKVFCGQKSHGKKLPSFIFNVSEKYKKLLLEKMIDGDGSHSVNKRLGYTKWYIENNFSYTSKSLGVASGLDLLLKQLGKNHAINYRPSKQCYEIRTSTKHNQRIRTKVIEEPYNGFVYDLSVEGNNNFVDACGQVLLHNTDSSFLKVPHGKTKEDVLSFVKKINADLPQSMELDFEGYYKRGIFVTKRDGGAAKKRYALLDFDGKLKIVGFEYVRRDWAKIAKDTQREVIEAVLEIGDPKKAIEIVREKIKKLKEGKVEKKDLIIMTQLKKPIKKYDSIGPHVAAAKKAIERGKEIDVGSTLEFIITKNGKSISDRAELEEFVKQGNYDPDYYIKHQLVPAVIKIIAELGITEQDLIQGGKQQSLGAFA